MPAIVAPGEGRFGHGPRAFAAIFALGACARLYPAYELGVEPEREPAPAEAFNAGAHAYGAEDVQGAIEAPLQG